MARFNEKRAAAFASYTVTWFLTKHNGKKKILHFTKKQMNDFLDLERIRPEHIEYVREAVSKEGYAMAISGTDYYFFDPEEFKSSFVEISMRTAINMTEQFESMYGSDAADDFWSRGDLHK